MTKELLEKYLNNRCTPEELDEIIQWFKKEALSESGSELGYKDWDIFKDTREKVIEHDDKFVSLLDKIHHKINIKENNKTVGIGNRKETISIVTSWITRVAAVLLIPVLTFLFYTYSDRSFYSAKYSDWVVDSLEIIAPVGSRTVVQLSDGTEVHLNYGSKIKYPRIFKGGTRELELSGEGYFEVAHNPDKPFIVKTKNLNVKALGTKFNVLAYPESNIVATTLIEGKVVLDKPGSGGDIKTIGALEPGQHVDFNISTSQIVSSVKGNIDKYIAWKDGMLVFDNATIEEVAERLERMFNVDIEIADEIKHHTYTVTFIDEPLFQIIDLMTKATPVNYEIIPREKLPGGTFSKQKILFKK